MAKTAPKSRDDLCDLINKSGLLSETQLAELQAANGSDAAALLEQLVKDGRLTEWQAEQLRLGQFVLKLGDYQLLKEYEGWDFGRAFLAQHVTSGQQVSLKLLSSRFSQDEQLWKEFVADLRKVARIEHPRLAPFRDLAKSAGRQFLVGEVESAANWEQRLAIWGTPGSAGQARMLLQLADALDALHQRELVHGCLSTRRVRVDEAGELRITDIGLEKLLKGLGDGARTAAPLAPATGSKHGQSRVAADLYAAGALLEKLRIETTAKREPPSWWKSAAPSDEAVRALAAICQRLTADNAEPYSSAAELKDACRQWCDRYGIRCELSASSAARQDSSAGGSASESLAAPALVIDTRRRRKHRLPPPIATDSADAVPPRRHGRLLIISSVAVALIVAVIAGASYWSSRARATAAAQEQQKKAKSSTRAVKADENDTLETNPVIDERLLASADSNAGLSGAPAIPPALGSTGPAIDLAVNTAANVDLNAAPAQGSAPPNPNTDSLPVPDAPLPAIPAPDATAANTQPMPDATPPVPEPMPQPMASSETTSTAEPAPPATGDPFSELPVAVALPDRQSAAGGDPTLLAKVHVDDQTLCYLTLLGGERVGRSPQSIKIENSAGGTVERMWDVFATESAGNRTLVAQMTLQGGELHFRWLEKAKTVDLAGMLENCLLQITINEQKKVVALRQPIIAEPIVLDLDKGVMTVKWQVPNLPDPASCRLELVGVEGPFPKHSTLPVENIPAVNGSQWVFFGEQKTEQVLALHVESVLRRIHQVTITAYSQRGEDPDKAWLKDRTRRTTKSPRIQVLNAVKASVQQLSDRVKIADAIPEAQLSEIDKQQKNLLKVDLEKATAMATMLDKLEELCKSLNDVGKLHFRVVYEVEGNNIELLRTTGG